MVPFNYRLHGLTLASEFALPELSVRQVQPPFRVDLRVQRAVIDQSNSLDTQLPYLKRVSGGALFTLDDVGQFLVREGCEISLDARDGADEALLRLFLFGSIIGMALHQRGFPFSMPAQLSWTDKLSLSAGCPAQESPRLPHIVFRWAPSFWRMMFWFCRLKTMAPFSVIPGCPT